MIWWLVPFDELHTETVGKLVTAVGLMNRQEKWDT
jgi:hypothetical protein